MNNTGYRTAFGLSTFTTAIGIASIYEYLGIVLTILGIVSAILSIILSIKTWYKNANADGKITKEEVDELLNDENIKESIGKIKEDIEDMKK